MHTLRTQIRLRLVMLHSDSINWFPIINWSNLWVTLYICLPYYMWDMKTSSKSVFVQHGALETAHRFILPRSSPVTVFLIWQIMQEIKFEHYFFLQFQSKMNYFFRLILKPKIGTALEYQASISCLWDQVEIVLQLLHGHAQNSIENLI